MKKNRWRYTCIYKGIDSQRCDNDLSNISNVDGGHFVTDKSTSLRWVIIDVFHLSEGCIKQLLFIAQGIEPATID